MFWIEKLFNKNKLNIVQSLFLSSLLSIIPILILFSHYLVTRTHVWKNFTPRMIWGIICGLIWIGLSPLLINNYFSITKTFFDNCKNSNIFNKDITVLKINIKNNFGKDKTFFITFVCWLSLVEFALVKNDMYIKRFGINGFEDIYFYIFCLCIGYILYLTSIGIYGILHTLNMIKIIVENQYFKIDFLNSDTHAGINFILEYIFKTTKLFATGVLFMPILLDYILFTKIIIIKIILYIAIGLYSLTLFASVIIPLKKIKQYVEQQKKDYLEELNNKYRFFLQYSFENYSIIKASEYYYSSILYNNINLIKDTILINISTTKCLELFTAIILPILSLFINYNDISSLLKNLLK